MSGPVYSQRPSKEVTRRIFVDMLHRLLSPADISRYQYVGFGALEFVDFDMIHRQFGITKMTSIENDPNIDRFRANAPYKCVSVLGGNSTDMLARVDWSGLSIVWLDYESQLNQAVFSDIEYLCSKLVPGSVFALTLNADPGKLDGRASRLESNVGGDRVPQGIDDDVLGGWGWAATQQRIVFSALRSRLRKRTDSASWWQTLNIRYRDGARMQLIAGEICTPALESGLESRHLERLDYFKPDANALEIEIPYLTAHEQSLLRKKLPRTPRQRLSLPGVNASEISQYAAHYQWIGA